MAFKFTFNVWYSRGARILSKITYVGFHGKPLIFFYFCDLVSLIMIGILRGFTAETEPRRPSLGTRWFQFFLSFREYHKILYFFCPHFREYHPKFKQIINEIQVTKIKKYEWFTMKSSIGDIWDKFYTL